MLAYYLSALPKWKIDKTSDISDLEIFNLQFSGLDLKRVKSFFFKEAIKINYDSWGIFKAAQMCFIFFNGRKSSSFFSPAQKENILQQPQNEEWIVEHMQLSTLAAQLAKKNYDVMSNERRALCIFKIGPHEI